MQLFKNFEELFSGNLGTVTSKIVSLRLKSNAKAFHSKPYVVAKSIKHVGRGKGREGINSLVKLGVLQKSTESPWGLLSFFRPKKNGGN